MNLNKIFILGNLAADPEAKTTTSGQALSRFRVVTNRVWNDPTTKEKREKAEFHSVVAWGRLAEIANRYLVKGKLVLIEGRVETRSWKDQQGQTKYWTEIIAENMQLGPRTADQIAGTGTAAPVKTKEEENENGTRDKEGSRAHMPALDAIPVIEEESPPMSEEEKDIKPEDIPF